MRDAGTIMNAESGGAGKILISIKFNITRYQSLRQQRLGRDVKTKRTQDASQNSKHMNTGMVKLSRA
jgi:hypothetical protein